MLPLTAEVGAAILAYLRDGRPTLPHRQVFLRSRAPAGTLKPTALTEAFQGWVRRSGLPIPYQGPHCLRHSLAVHLLRQGTPLKTIGDLLGHRSTESTCVYLRLHVEDLRDVALDLPADVRGEVQP
jgi:site-specific recombinase XerD